MFLEAYTDSGKLMTCCSENLDVLVCVMPLVI